MSKEYHPPHWFYSNAMRCMYHWPGGDISPGEQIPLNKCSMIRESELHTLVPFLFEKGYLNVFLTKQSRDEDLKITHRLLDILQHEVGMKNA